MKKKRVVLSILLACLFSIANVHASKCGDEEIAKINEEAAKVKVSYDILTKQIPNPNDPNDAGEKDETIDVDYIKVSIINLTDNLYIKIVNSKDNTTKTFYGTDATDGVVSYEIADTSAIANLDYVVYTTLNTSCANEEIMQNQIVLPKYNENYGNGACNLNPDAPECQKYVTKEITPEDMEKFATKEADKKIEDIKKEDDKKKKEEEDKNKSFIEKNKKEIIIGGSIIIVIGVVTTAVVIKKRRSRLIWWKKIKY